MADGRETYHPERDKPLPTDIETLCPDYSLYPENDKAIGFCTRGCPNACPFCVVAPKEGRKSERVGTVTDFWRGQKEITLCDPNLLACKERDQILAELKSVNARIDFNQGLDARFLTPDIVKTLNSMRINAIHFAFDRMQNEKAILRGLSCFRENYDKSLSHVKVYVLTNYETSAEEDWYRVQKIRELGLMPDIRIYQKGTQSQFVTDLARWCNAPMLYKSTDFADYVPRVDGKSCGELYPQIVRKEYTIMPEAKTNKSLTIYAKLAKARQDFLAQTLTKSGKNIHAEFEYFELKDIVPAATEIFSKYGLLFLVTFEDGVAYGRLIDIDNSENTITVQFSIAHLPEPAKFRMNEIQAVGAEITYYRRYLYMMILDIVDRDEVDGGVKTEPKKDTPKEPPKKPATTEERKVITEQLTDTPNATTEKVNELKGWLKKLVNKDPGQEEFVQTIAVKTDGFKSIKADVCDALIEKVQEMLGQYGDAG